MLFTVGGQCEGYGGIFEALRTLIPVEHAWHAEIDKDACKVLAHHYPGVLNLGDITAVDWQAVERPDIFTSGFPCQPLSAAGKRLGAADERFLWPTGVLPAIAALRPRLVILENVRGMLSADGGAIFGGILADLDALGYSASWATIGACLVGACHHRHRVFLTATRADVHVSAGRQVARRGRGGWEAVQGVLFGAPDVAPKWPAAGVLAGGRVWAMSADTCGGKAGVLPTPTARDASRGAGWGHLPGRPLSEVVAMLPTVRASDTFGAGPHGDGGVDLRTTVTLLPTPRATDGTHGSPNQRGSSGGLALPSAVQSERFGKFGTAVHRHEIAYGLSAPPPTEPDRNGNPRLSRAFCEFMQGLRPGWLTDIVGKSAAIRLAGNGVNPRQCAFALASSPAFRSWAEQNTPVTTHGGV
jgi:DNA (cytosine-5)-methyltransferase 1